MPTTRLLLRGDRRFLPALILTVMVLLGPVAGTAARAAEVDVGAELAKFRAVEMPYDSRSLSARQRQLVARLVEATRYADDIYWEQSDPAGHELYRSLAGSSAPHERDLRRLLMINGSRYDLIRDQAPFGGAGPRPPGANLYPADLTRAEFDAYVLAHPAEKAALIDPFTVVRRKGPALVAIPYHVAYARWLAPIARALRQAADLADDPAFARYLRLRAKAVLTDDYLQADLAWLDLENPRIDVIFGPYETYLDDLLGVKTAYEGAVLIRNDAESAKLEVYRKYVPDIQDSLPLDPLDRPSKRGHASPMEVMDAPYRGGDMRHGYQAVADNLPNDPRVHEQKGSKKLFFKNYMDARVEYVILPIAKRLLRDDQARFATADGYLTTTLMHEMSHGLGPAFARMPAGRTDIREAIGAQYSGLEEAKADMVGLLGLKWLVDHGELPASKLPEWYASEVAGIFRTVRFGVAEAHGRAEIMEFNFFAEHDAIRYDEQLARYVIDFERMPAAVAAVSKELLEQEATGDRARTEAWFAKYGSVPPQLAHALEQVSDVPVDIDPVSVLDRR